MRNLFTAIFKLIARLLVVFLALLTVIATMGVVLLTSIEHTLLNSKTQRQAFINNRVYERIPVVAAGEFTMVKNLFEVQCARTPQACASQSMTLLNAMSLKQWETLIIHFFPADELQTLTESTLDETTGYFHGETDTVQIPLAHLKARLTNKAGEELTLLLMESQPLCNVEQQEQIKAMDLDVVGAPPIFCLATGEMQIQLSFELRRRLKNVSTELPDEVVIIKSPSITPGLRTFFGEDGQSAPHKLKLALPYGPLLPLALLLLLALFAVRSLRGWMRWWGIPIFIAGLMTLIFGSLLFFMFDQLWMKYVLHELPPLLASGFGIITQDVARSLTNDLA
ncbi:MAG: hypothetical protein ABIQ77_00440, partial [Anaerolineales bacterium]